MIKSPLGYALYFTLIRYAFYFTLIFIGITDISQGKNILGIITLSLGVFLLILSLILYFKNERNSDKNDDLDD